MKYLLVLFVVLVCFAFQLVSIDARGVPEVPKDAEVRDVYNDIHAELQKVNVNLETLLGILRGQGLEQPVPVRVKRSEYI